MPELEQKFRVERFETTLNRVRGIFIAAILVTAGTGLQEVDVLADRGLHELVALSFSHRFLGAIPIYAVLLAATWLPGSPWRSSLVLGVGVTAAIWSFGLLRWQGAAYLEQQAIATMVLLDVVVCLLITVLTLPLPFSSMVAVAIISIGGIAVFFGSTVWQEVPRMQGQFLGSALGLVSFAILLQWFRERWERRLFAHREHAERLNQKLSRLNREKNEFMTIVAHDLRSPLTIVKYHGEILQTKRMTTLKKQRAYAQIREQAQRMLNLVNNYLGTHALETGTVRIDQKHLNLADVARRLHQSLAPQARAKRQSITLSLFSRMVWVMSDAAVLHQIGENYLNNALKFSPPGANIQLQVESINGGDRTRLSVANEGPSIPLAEHNRLFQKFGRTSAKPTGGETSHGLGLAVVKGLAERLQVEVGFESSVERGTTFWVELPVVEPPVKASPVAQPSNPT